MKDYSTNNILNIALTGHAATGKTTLSEAMAFNGGLVHKMGNIGEGTTISDYRENEINNQHSISLSLLNFEWLEKNGNLSKEEMLPVFNMGIGFVICVSVEDVDATLSLLQNEGEKPRVIGRVVRGNRNVILE